VLQALTRGRCRSRMRRERRCVGRPCAPLLPPSRATLLQRRLDTCWPVRAQGPVSRNPQMSQGHRGQLLACSWQ